MNTLYHNNLFILINYLYRYKKERLFSRDANMLTASAHLRAYISTYGQNELYKIIKWLKRKIKCKVNGNFVIIINLTNFKGENTFYGKQCARMCNVAYQVPVPRSRLFA